MVENRDKTEIHGFFEINSYSLSQGLINFRVGAFGAYVFFFYETEVLLNVVLLAVALSIFAVWDAINDPLLGNLTDKPYKFTKRYGRRFPWVLIGVFPWAILYILIFTAPVSEQFIIFLYLIIIVSVYDTFFTLWNVNSEALLPFKFRNMEERRKVSGTKGFWGVIGLVLGLIIPPLIVDYGIRETYINQAVILAIITVIAGLLMLPGHREDRTMISDYLELTSSKPKKITFFKDLIMAFKKKNFVLMLFLHFTYTILTSLLIASLNYFVRYNLQEESSALILAMSGYLIISIVSIPFWIRIANKVNNNKLMITIGAVAMATAAIPLFFANSIFTLLIVGSFIGLTGGIFFVMQDTINCDVLDENVVLDGERLEGTYMGIKFFIGRLADVFQFLTLGIIHIFTGFLPEVETQTPYALLGIRLHMSIIPAIALLVGALVFHVWYDITPKKSQIIQKKMNELNL